MHLPHSLSDTTELISLVKAAGFGEILSKEVTRTISFPSIEEFIVQFTSGSMLASYFSDKKKVDDISQDKLVKGAGRKLFQFVDEHSGKLSFPLRTRLVSANKNS
jgi:hypothetical protein